MKYLVYLVAFIVVVIGLHFLKIDINANIASYFVSTTLDKLIVLFAVIIFPIYIIKKILKSIIGKIKHDIYINNIINFINTITEEKDRNSLISILKNSDNIKFIKQIKDIRNLLSLKKYDKAINLIDNIKVKNYNETLLLKYRCKIYKEKNDLANFIIYAKKGISLKNDSLWFLTEMFELVYSNKLLDSEITYLYNALKLIKNSNEAQYKKYFCLISYFYAQYLYKQDVEKSKSIAKKAIKDYPDFTPLYEFLIKIYSNQNKSDRINDILKDLWKNNKSIETIKLWQKHYTQTNESKLLNDISAISTDIEKNNLLIAGMYICNDKFLEAHNILQNTKDTSLTKVLIELDVMQKENNYKSINKVTNELVGRFSPINFWNTYIS